MTDKEFVLENNPKMYFNGYNISVTEFGIFIKDVSSGALIMPPIPLSHEKQMWKTLRKRMEYQMLRILEQ